MIEMILRVSKMNPMVFYICFVAFLVLLVYVIFDFYFEVEKKENEEWLLKIK